MSFYHPSRDPKWHSDQAAAIEQLDCLIKTALLPVTLPLWLFWKAYYAVVGRPKPLRDGDGALRAVRRLARPWYVRQQPRTLNQETRYKLREDAFVRKILPPLPIADDELDRSVPTPPFYWDRDAKPHGRLVKLDRSVDTHPAHTIPFPGKIPNAAYLWNQAEGCYDVYEEGKPLRKIPDPWPHRAKTDAEIQGTPVSAEQFVRDHADDIQEFTGGVLGERYDRPSPEAAQQSADVSEPAAHGVGGDPGIAGPADLPLASEEEVL